MNDDADSALDMQIGAALREARLTQGFTQDELARALGVNRTTIARYESGIRSLSISALLQVARALTVPVTVLVPGLQTLAPPPPPPTLTNLYAYPDETVRHHVAELPPSPTTSHQTAVQMVVRVLEQHPDLVAAVLETLEIQLRHQQDPAADMSAR